MNEEIKAVVIKSLYAQGGERRRRNGTEVLTWVLGSTQASQGNGWVPSVVCGWLIE